MGCHGGVSLIWSREQKCQHCRITENGFQFDAYALSQMVQLQLSMQRVPFLTLKYKRVLTNDFYVTLFHRLVILTSTVKGKKKKR